MAAQEKLHQQQQQMPVQLPASEVDWDLGLPAELDGDWAEVSHCQSRVGDSPVWLLATAQLGFEFMSCE